MEVPMIKASAIKPAAKENVCFFMYRPEPRCPMTWEEGMKYLQEQEKRFLRKYKAATFAGESKGAHATAACYGDIYRRAKRTGKNALLAEPMSIEDELEATYKRLGYDKLNAESEDEDDSEEGIEEDEAEAQLTSE